MAKEVVTCSAGNEKGTRDAASLLEDAGGGAGKEIWTIMTDSVPRVRGFVLAIHAKTLIYAGASVSLISEEIWNRTAKSGKITKDELALVMAIGEPLQILGRGEVVHRIGEEEFSHDVLIAPRLPKGYLLGADFLRAHQCDVTFFQNCVLLRGKAVPFLSGEENASGVAL
jgi:hypothetical protein